ncbi:hypothetical protein ACBY01_07125 [Sphingomonas sp. ac-8]|uniref:hypothetical protein n=1 Tax=Sphingomonas sp. ac-8 TaxID=3242977 RepID=UPI003A81191F
MAADQSTAKRRRTRGVFDFGFRLGAGMASGAIVAFGLPRAALQLGKSLWQAVF